MPFFFALALLPGQYSTRSSVTPPPTPTSASGRAEARDQALQRVGEDARGFTKAHGDIGIKALLEISPEVGQQLVSLFRAGKLNLPRMQDALSTVAHHGEKVAKFLTANHAKLTDADAMDVFLEFPHDCALDLIDVTQLAQARKAERERMMPKPPPLFPEWAYDSRVWVGAGIAAGVIGLLAWRRRQMP